MFEAAADNRKRAAGGGNLHIEFGRMAEEGTIAHNWAVRKQEAEVAHRVVRRVEAVHIEADRKAAVRIDPEDSSAGLVFGEPEVEEPVAECRECFEAECRDYSVAVAESALGVEQAVGLA